jgi:uncharacterized membrane protein YfcA
VKTSHDRPTYSDKTANAAGGALAAVAADAMASMVPYLRRLKETNPQAYTALLGAAIGSVLGTQQNAVPQQPPTDPRSIV